MDYATESLRLHGEWKGKIEVVSRVPVNDKDQLSLAYTPGVAQPCLEIQKDMDKSYELTRRHNLVAVITDGTAVLGLGDIGPEAGMPVMEGKCALFKAFEPRPGPDGRHHQPGAVQRHLGRCPSRGGRVRGRQRPPYRDEGHDPVHG